MKKRLSDLVKKNHNPKNHDTKNRDTKKPDPDARGAGVETGERFTINEEDFGFVFWLDADGCLVFDDPKAKRECRITPDIIYLAINRGIIRKPRLSEEQEYVLKALYVAFDFKWVAKQEDGQVMAFEEKPQKHKDYFSGETQWYCGEGEEEKDYGWKVKPSSPICGLVSWSDPEPLDIVQTLQDADELEEE